MAKNSYDVFLSYNSKDKGTVHHVADKLKEAGLKVWFDVWELPIGTPFQRNLSQGVINSRVVVVFVGPSGIGFWQNMEVQYAVEQHANQGKSVITVILPCVKKVPKLPPFLNIFPSVDFRSVQLSHADLNELIGGITGINLQRFISHISQTGEEFSLELPSQRSIDIYSLPNHKNNELLKLTWKTFGECIEKLQFQIANYGRRHYFDACFGINDAGLVMATFLNSSVLGRVKIGYIRYKGNRNGRMVSYDDSFFPALDSEPTIMLMDFELKSGGNLKMCVSRILQEYKGAQVYFAALAALTENENPRVSCFEELKAAENIKGLEIKDLFIACTMVPPGIEPPLGLR